MFTGLVTDVGEVVAIEDRGELKRIRIACAYPADGIALDVMRVRGFPFPESVRKFVEEHDQVFVVEQNRDAQLRTLLINEEEINPAKLLRVLHYDGSPITARFIAGAIGETASSLKIVPLRKAVP